MNKSESTELETLRTRVAELEAAAKLHHAFQQYVVGEGAWERFTELERIVDGLSQDAIDGGFTVRGMSRYAKRLEEERDSWKLRAEQAEFALEQAERERHLPLP